VSQLIINADDFGLANGVTDAIVECHLAGTVTSTTLMTNMGGAEYALRRANELPELSVGVHLNLTLGKPISPLSDVKDLVGADGEFYAPSKQFKNLSSRPHLYGQVYREFRAQMEWLLDRGYKPSHIDSHHHVLRFFPAAIAGGVICRNYNITAIRSNVQWLRNATELKMPAKISRGIRSLYHASNTFIWSFIFGLNHPRYKVFLPSYESLASDRDEYFNRFLKSLPSEISELSIHPGFAGAWTQDGSRMAGIRVFEYQLFRDPLIAQSFSDAGITLKSFKDIN